MSLLHTNLKEVPNLFLAKGNPSKPTSQKIKNQFTLHINNNKKLKIFITTEASSLAQTHSFPILKITPIHQKRFHLKKNTKSLIQVINAFNDSQNQTTKWLRKFRTLKGFLLPPFLLPDSSVSLSIPQLHQCAMHAKKSKH